MKFRAVPWSLRFAIILVAVPVITLVAIATDQLLWRRPALRLTSAWLMHTHEVIATAQTLDRMLLRSELGQKTYLQTGDPKDLESSRAEAARIPVILADLKQKTSDNPQQQQAISALEPQIDARLKALKSTPPASGRTEPDAAHKLARADSPPSDGASVSALIEDFIATEKRLLQERRTKLEKERVTTESALELEMGVAITLLLLGVVLLPIVAYRFVKSMRTQHESEQRFLHFVDGVSDYAIYLLDPDGKVVSWNTGAERIKGYTAEEIIGKHFSSFYTEEDRLAGKPERALRLAVENGRFEDRGWRVRKDGTRFNAGVVLRPIRDQAGRISGFAKITRDISEIVRERKALEQTRAALAQSQKMESLGQLSGGIAHDFNNLLHVISNSVEVLSRHPMGSDPKVTGVLSMVKRSAERGTALTKRLLAFSRKQPLEPKSLDPNRLVSDASELLRRTLGESVALETVLAGGIWACLADPNQLESAILNLAVNARDAMPSGGKLTIETANSSLDDAYCAVHRDVSPGQYVLIAVSDTGTGMTQETIASAFEPFFTTKAVGKGTGLGLSQVYGFTKQSGGHVKIYSEVGAGTTVKLYLPRSTTDAAHPEATRAASENLAANLGETILLVEDDEYVRIFTKDMLRDLGYAVQVAGDAREALQILQSAERVDLLFTDIGLPNGVNGRQLADQAHGLRNDLLVLFTTAYTRNAIVHHGRLDAGVELIVKPFTKDELSRKLRRILDSK